MDSTERPENPMQEAPGFVCGFGRGTRLLTADGPVPVEDIEPGEAILDWEGRPHFVLWQGGWDMRPVPGWAADPRHPMVIPANAFGPGKPRRDLHLCQTHRVMVETAGEWAALSARSLAPHLARMDLSGRPISYHAVMTRGPCKLMAENLPCESHVPGLAEQDVAVSRLALSPLPAEVRMLHP
jgi:hypothetical protein